MASVLCLACGAAVAEPAATPKAAPPNTVAPVTVTAPAKPKTIEKQSQSFVEGHATVQNPEVDQIGRWRDPVCVQVLGLPHPDDASMVEARIEAVAQAVGLPAARGGCRANVEIVFSNQPQRVMDEVARRREYLLGYFHRHDRGQLKAVTHPIQAWYVTSTRGTGEGNVAMMFTPNLGQFAQVNTQVIDDPDHRPPGGCAGSHFTACLQSDFANVFIVADTKALAGRQLGLVTDYLVMLALSQPRALDRCNPLPSILDLLADCTGRDPPDGLTPADAAYLTSLYAADSQAKRMVEQSEIASRMAKILIRAKAGGR
jgi:hypothetical protein